MIFATNFSNNLTLQWAVLLAQYKCGPIFKL